MNTLKHKAKLILSVSVTAGSLKGRKILFQRSPTLRPTRTYVRELVFNVLEHNPHLALNLSETRFLDACAGTGIMGFEALSRGAAHASFIDENKDILANIQSTASLWGLIDKIATWRFNLAQRPFKPAPEALPFKVVFLDPPYNTGLLTRIVHNTLASMLPGKGILVVEVKARIPTPTLTKLFEDNHMALHELVEKECGISKLLFFVYEKTKATNA